MWPIDQRNGAGVLKSYLRNHSNTLTQHMLYSYIHIYALCDHGAMNYAHIATRAREYSFDIYYKLLSVKNIRKKCRTNTYIDRARS